MLDRNKDYNKISFLDSFFNSQKKDDIKEEPTKEKTDSVKIEGAKKLNNEKAIDSRAGNSQVLSAHQGTIKDTGGPKKHMGSETSNSIWDSGVLDKIVNSQDNKEKTIEEKKMKKSYYDEVRKERRNDIVESLKNTDMRKDSTITSVTPYKGNNYKLPKRNISIFDDTTDFARIPEKTNGEKVAEEVRAIKEKDDSWKKVSRATTSKDIVNKLFDKLTQEKSEKN